MKLQLILASESPRRKELLEKAGFSLKVKSVNVSESLTKNLNINDQIIDIARRKARAALPLCKSLISGDFLILAADTMVVLGDRALGKPVDSQEAESILLSLSGRQHQVKTALCLVDSVQEEEICDLCTTEVFFRPILRQEVLDYISTGEPMDKAGSYAIQGQGGKFVEKIVGPYDNVVGLPVELFKKLLVKKNWTV